MCEAAEDEHEALIQFLYMAPIGLLQARIDGEILLVNPLCAQLLMPLAPGAALDNLYHALANLAPDLAHRVADFDAPHGKVCDALQLPVHAPGAEGVGAQVLSLTLLKLDSQRLMAVLSDVTEAVRCERELRQNQAWISAIASNISDYALVPLDPAGRISGWNPSIARVTGFEAEAVEGRPMSVFYPDGQLPPARLADRLVEADQHGWTLDEGWRCRADGSRYWGSCLVAPLHLRGEPRTEERAFSLIIRDITDRREANEALRRSALCDHLTGLANRRAFFETGEAELARWRLMQRPLTLVAVDADHFKQINDRHGHAAGDAVLRHLAAGLGATFRDVDTVARTGGEEFVVLLPGTPLEGALVAAGRLCRHMAEKAVTVDGVPIRCTVSAGVAAMDAQVNDLDSLMKRADQALYQAKAQGRNRVACWQPGLGQPAALVVSA